MTELQTLTLRTPDDAHLHLRDGAALASVAPHSARQFGRAVIMPNLKSPVVSTALALAYQARIAAAVPAGSRFRPLMTLYMTEALTVDEIERAVAAGVVAVKLYPAGATTNSAAGVTDLRRVAPVLEAMQRLGLVLSLHGEVTDPAIDVFDREKVFIDRHLVPMRREFPALKIVVEHITTTQAAQFVAEAGPATAASITPQHLLFNRNALFLGGLRPHHYCLPVLKREAHRLALVEAATSGSDRYFLGTDSAPHAAALKEHAVGCAGCYSGYTALELYAEVFDRAGALDKLDAFAGARAAHFYGWPLNDGTVSLQRRSWTVPESLPFGDADVKPLCAGETLAWQFVDSDVDTESDPEATA